MPSWAINSTKMSNYIKLNKMEETSKNNETAQLGIGGVSNCTYLFFRADGFYPIELKDDADAIANAECNNGTLQVQDINGRIVWGV